MKTKYLIALAAVNMWVMVSCKKTDPIPAFDDVNSFYAKNKTQGEVYTVNVDNKADTIVTNKLTEIIFPQGAFNKTGDINVRVKEITSVNELVLTNTPNNIDSTVNHNPVVFEITADAATLEAGKVFKVTTPNKGFDFDRLSAGAGIPWIIDNGVQPSTDEPVAGNNTPLRIQNLNGKVSFTYNKLGMFAPSRNPFAAVGHKAKVKLKLYGYMNTPSVNTYVIYKDYNAVSAAKRFTDSDFSTDSLLIGSKVQFVTISYNQAKKYFGYADAEITDSLTVVPISMAEVSNEEEIKSKVNTYIK